MPSYLYRCPVHGEFESPISGDVIEHGPGCGTPSRRIWAISLNRTSLKAEGHWSPIVGQYVENMRELDSAIEAARDLQSEKLGMECKLAKVDPRDTSALAELHGMSVEQRIAEGEATERARHDALVTK